MLNLHSRISVTEDRPQLPTKRAPMPNSSLHGGAHMPGLSQSRCPRGERHRLFIAACPAAH